MIKKKIINKIRKRNKIKIFKKLSMKINYLTKKNRVMKLKILIGRKIKISKANQSKSKISQTTKKLIGSILMIREVIIIIIITMENIDTQESIEVILITISITSRKIIKKLSHEMANAFKKDHSRISKLIRISLKTLKIRYQLNKINFIANLKITSLTAEEEEDRVEEAYTIKKIIQDPSIILSIIKITITITKDIFLEGINKIVNRMDKILDGIETILNGIETLKEEAFVILINIIIIITIIIIIVIINTTIVMIIITIIINKVNKDITNKIIKIITCKIINSKIIEAKEVVMAVEEMGEEEYGEEG